MWNWLAPNLLVERPSKSHCEAGGTRAQKARIFFFSLPLLFPCRISHVFYILHMLHTALDTFSLWSQILHTQVFQFRMGCPSKEFWSKMNRIKSPQITQEWGDLFWHHHLKWCRNPHHICDWRKKMCESAVDLLWSRVNACCIVSQRW